MMHSTFAARRLMGIPPESASVSNVPPEKCEEEKSSADTVKTDYNLKPLASTDLRSQATAYARPAESEAVKTDSVGCGVNEENLNFEFGDFSVLPVSAESAKLLPEQKDVNRVGIKRKSIGPCVGSSGGGRGGT